MSKHIQYSDECKQWVIDNNYKYKSLKEMYIDYINKFDYIKYNTFKSLRGRLIKLEPKNYTEEEKNFIVECIVDREIGYAQITPLFNKKFGKNKTTKQLISAGNNWGLKCIKYNLKWRNDFKPNVPIDYHYLKQHPVGTILKVKRGKRFKLIIKIKLIPKELICSGKDFRDDNEYWYPYARYVYENHYKCKLKPNEYVYHLDGNVENNNIENLICGNYGVLGYVVGKGFDKSTPEIRKIGFKLAKLNQILKEES